MLSRALRSLAAPVTTLSPANATSKTKVKEFKNVAEIQIGRYDPHGSGFRIESFHYDMTQTFMVMDLLIAIKVHHDPSLAFRNSCCEGICGSCAMNINGTNTLACITEAQPRTVVLPLPNIPILKDLVNDFRFFFKQYELIKPYSGNMNKDRYHIHNIYERYLQKLEESKHLKNRGPLIEELLEEASSTASTQPSTADKEGFEAFKQLVSSYHEADIDVIPDDTSHERLLREMSKIAKSARAPPVRVLPTQDLTLQQDFNYIFDPVFVRQQAVRTSLAQRV